MKKKALVVGGSNGIGLAITKELIDKDYFVNIVDKVEPEENHLLKELYSYTYCDLSEYDEDLWNELAKDKTIDFLMISSGIGRIATFDTFPIKEIEKTFKINTIAVAYIIKHFYNHILSDKPFYCGVMASISGRISSPIAALYAASKASVVRLIESINIEIEKSGVNNRILEVSPGYIKGTNFYGDKNNLDETKQLAKDIIEKILKQETVFIPAYEETYKRVIDNYNQDARKFGLESYEYKQNSKRINNKTKMTVGYMSGTFDLFHQGHLNILKKAKENCDYLIVGVHGSGKWKGKETMVPLEERKAIVAACKYVDKVIDSCTEDKDVWDSYPYDKLFVGSDYKGTERFKVYEEYFKDKGVEIVYFPYTPSVSSTLRRKQIHDAEEKSK